MSLSDRVFLFIEIQTKALKYKELSVLERALWGFGSCHSFGVAVGLCGYGMCQMKRGLRRGTLLKKAKGRPLLLCQPSLNACVSVNRFAVHVLVHVENLFW